MLKVPRMLDEIDPLPTIGPKPVFGSLLSESLIESMRSQWAPVTGKPHFYTRNGKLKYEPPIPESVAPKSAASYCDPSSCSANLNQIVGQQVPPMSLAEQYLEIVKMIQQTTMILQRDA